MASMHSRSPKRPRVRLSRAPLSRCPLSWAETAPQYCPGFNQRAWRCGLRPHDARKLVVCAGGVVGEAHISDSSLLLPITEGGEMDLPIEQIADLYQIARFGFQESHRASHLGDSAS